MAPSDLVEIEARSSRQESFDRSKASSLQRELSKRISGEVRFDSASKAIYATDASNYRQVPIGVVIPRTQQDVIETIAICRKYQAPVLSRGGGTSLAGQCCNAAVVIDWSKYLNRIIELNVEQKFARVEPGTICDEVVKAAPSLQPDLRS